MKLTLSILLTLFTATAALAQLPPPPARADRAGTSEVQGQPFRAWTQNFSLTVYGTDCQASADNFGLWAEKWRKEKAIEWLGKEMPNWTAPCPLTIKVTKNAPDVTYSSGGGATSFAFEPFRVTVTGMNVEGSVDRITKSVLPHEITHTVLAYHFGQPVPRWCDEGMAVCSEDEKERRLQMDMAVQLANLPRAVPIQRLFAAKDYPPDVMAFYVQGYSVTDYLIRQSSRKVFLQYVAKAQTDGWDAATKQYYQCDCIQLEGRWLKWLRGRPRVFGPSQQVAVAPQPYQQQPSVMPVPIAPAIPPMTPGLPGAAGPKGDPGQAGATGAPGPAGPQGPATDTSKLEALIAQQNQRLAALESKLSAAAPPTRHVVVPAGAPAPTK